MGIFDAIKVAGKAASTGQQNDKPVKVSKLTFSKESLDSAADDANSGFDGLMDNLGSFFRPAGTAAVDLVGHENMGKGLKAYKEKAADYRGSFVDKLSSLIPGGGVLARIPNADEEYGPTLAALGSAYNAATSYENADYTTDKFKQRMEGSNARFAQQAAEVAKAKMDGKKNKVETAANAVLGENVGSYFDRNTPDVADVAQEQGYSPLAAGLVSMLNPLEWVQSEGKVAALDKLGVAAKTGKAVRLMEKAGVSAENIAKFNKAREAVNVAGQFLDPMQVGFDAVGHVAGKAGDAYSAYKAAGKPLEIATDAETGLAHSVLNAAKEGNVPESALIPDAATPSPITSRLESILNMAPGEGQAAIEAGSDAARADRNDPIDWSLLGHKGEDAVEATPVAAAPAVDAPLVAARPPRDPYSWSSPAEEEWGAPIRARGDEIQNEMESLYSAHMTPEQESRFDALLQEGRELSRQWNEGPPSTTPTASRPSWISGYDNRSADEVYDMVGTLEKDVEKAQGSVETFNTRNDHDRLVEAQQQLADFRAYAESRGVDAGYKRTTPFVDEAVDVPADELSWEEAWRRENAATLSPLEDHLVQRILETNAQLSRANPSHQFTTDLEALRISNPNVGSARLGLKPNASVNLERVTARAMEAAPTPDVAPHVAPDVHAADVVPDAVDMAPVVNNAPLNPFDVPRRRREATLVVEETGLQRYVEPPSAPPPREPYSAPKELPQTALESEWNNIVSDHLEGASIQDIKTHIQENTGPDGWYTNGAPGRGELLARVQNYLRGKELEAGKRVSARPMSSAHRATEVPGGSWKIRVINPKNPEAYAFMEERFKTLGEAEDFAKTLEPMGLKPWVMEEKGVVEGTGPSMVHVPATTATERVAARAADPVVHAADLEQHGSLPLRIDELKAADEAAAAADPTSLSAAYDRTYGADKGKLKLSMNPLDYTWKPAKFAMDYVSGKWEKYSNKLEAWLEKFAPNAPSKPGVARDATEALKRVFTENPGRVDAATGDVARAAAEASNAHAGITVDMFKAVANGDLRSILGQSTTIMPVVTRLQREQLRAFMTGGVVHGVKMTEADMVKLGFHQDLIDAGKMVRGLMDFASDDLMAETYKLPQQWFRALNFQERDIVGKLTETMGHPQLRAKVNAVVGNHPATNATFYADAQRIVAQGHAELMSDGLLIKGDPKDIALQWAPYLANRGSYDPKMYLFHEMGVANGDVPRYLARLEERLGHPIDQSAKDFVLSNYTNKSASAGVSNEAKRLLARKDLPIALQDILQQIQDPMYTFAVGIHQVNELKNKMKIRRWASQQDRFVSRAGESHTDFIARTGLDPQKVAELDDARLGQMGTNVNFGALLGRSVDHDFWDLMVMNHLAPSLNQAGGVSQTYQWALNRFKFWHTVVSPTGQARQAMQNAFSVWNAAGGTALINLPSVRKSLINRDAFYLEARNAGILGHKSLHDLVTGIDDGAWRELSFNGLEHTLMERLPRFGEFAATTLNKMRVEGGEWASKMWGGVDDVFRMAMFKTLRDRGKSIEEAANAVQGEVYSGLRNTRFENFMSGRPISGMQAMPGWKSKTLDGLSMLRNKPFFGADRFGTVQAYRALAGIRAGHWMPLTDPARFARSWTVMAAMYGLNRFIKQTDGIATEKELRERPDYMRPLLPTFLRLPQMVNDLVDEPGKSSYLDLSWVMPWGKFSGGNFNPKTGKTSTLLDAAAAEAPWSPLIAPFVEIYNNEDGFMHMPIYDAPVGSPDLGQRIKDNVHAGRQIFAHAWRTWLPVYAPNPVGGLADIMLQDGGADGKISMKETFRTFLQGVANDSGHMASKLASALYNSIDPWWDQHGDNIEKSMLVNDYRGRPQFFAKAALDAMGFRIDSHTMKSIDKGRGIQQGIAIKEVKKRMNDEMGRTQNPENRAAIRAKYSKIAQDIAHGKPDGRWYDDSWPADVATNTLNAIFYASYNKPQRSIEY